MTQQIKKFSDFGIRVPCAWSAQMKHVPERRGQPCEYNSARAALQMDAFPRPGRFRENRMTKKVKDEILHDHNQDGIDRRGFLKCMAWAGTGALCVMQGGVLKSYALPEAAKKKITGDLSFVQISDSHMGFNKLANPDVAATLQLALDRIKALQSPPEFMLHTGDVSQLSKPEQFDTVAQMVKGTPGQDIFYVPGEHDVLDDNGKGFHDRFGKD